MPSATTTLVRDELDYKTDVFDAALSALSAGLGLEPSRGAPGDRGRRAGGLASSAGLPRLRPRPLRPHLPLLAQPPRRRRSRRTRKCAEQLLALTNPQAALDAARDAGTRHIATARVVALDPLDRRGRLAADRRREPDRPAARRRACVRRGRRRRGQVPEGELQDLRAWRSGRSRSSTRRRRHFAMGTGDAIRSLAVGDELVVADFEWFCDAEGQHVPAGRPPEPDDVVGAEARLHPGRLRRGPRRAPIAAAGPTRPPRPSGRTSSLSGGPTGSSTPKSGRRSSTRTRFEVVAARTRRSATRRRSPPSARPTT